MNNTTRHDTERPSVYRLTAVAVALSALLMAARLGAAQTGFADLPLRELDQERGLSPVEVTLRDLASKYHREDHVGHLLVYLWAASSTWNPPVQRVVLEDLRSVNEWWREHRYSSRTTAEAKPLSIVAVYGRSEAERARVRSAVQRAARDARLEIPTFVDVTCRMAEAVAQADGEGHVYIPDLLLVSAETLAIEDRRRDDPVSAGAWVGPPHPPVPPDDPPGGPEDCTGSWFRRHIARMVVTGVMDAPDGTFRPKDPVTETEFIGWLDKISPQRAAGVLHTSSAGRPVELTRERAITALARFLCGKDTDSALAACPPPTGEATQGSAVEAAALWAKAFDRLPGSSNVSESLVSSLMLAHARGLLYAEPSLRAQWPLTREVAAWLLSHAAAVQDRTYTGILVDAAHLALVPDTRYAMGEIHVQEGDSTRVLHGSARALERLLMPAPGYPPTLYVDASHVDEGGPQREWLEQRVGNRPLVVRPLRILGFGTNADSVVISSEDAERIRRLNEATGALDEWRVAFTYASGVSAELVTQTDAPLPRDAKITVRLSAAMDTATVTSDTVWLQESGKDEKVPARISVRTRPHCEVDLQPETRLGPGTAYDVVLGRGLRSARGEPLEARTAANLPPGIARRWTITTENAVTVLMQVFDAPDGSKVYVAEELRGTTPLHSPLRIQTVPGSLTVRVEAPNGQTLRTDTHDVRDDATIETRIPPPKSARIAAQGAPAEITVGEKATITLEALDADGRPLRTHSPVVVSLAPAACSVSPAQTLTVENGKATFVVWSDQPGTLSVALSTNDPSIAVEPSRIELECVPVEPPPVRVWSAIERYCLPDPAAGERDILISPCLRRWLSLEPGSEAIVVEVEGGAFERTSRLAGPRQFVVDEAGLFHFHRSVAGKTVDIRYQYGPGKATCVPTGVSEGNPVAIRAARAVRVSCEERGYQWISSARLAEFSGGPTLGPEALAAKIRQAMDTLGLREVFVAEISALPDGDWALSWTVWSAGDNQASMWSSRGAGMLPVVLPADLRGGRQQIQDSLAAWFSMVGLEPSGALVSTRNQ